MLISCILRKYTYILGNEPILALLDLKLQLPIQLKDSKMFSKSFKVILFSEVSLGPFHHHSQLHSGE